MGLDESVTRRILREKVVVVLGDSLEGLGLSEVNGDEDEHVLARRRLDGSSGPNMTGAAICVYGSLKFCPTTQGFFSSMAMPKAQSSSGLLNYPCRIRWLRFR